jgi:hypothetical protein
MQRLYLDCTPAPGLTPPSCLVACLACATTAQLGCASCPGRFLALTALFHRTAPPQCFMLMQLNRSAVLPPPGPSQPVPPSPPALPLASVIGFGAIADSSYRCVARSTNDLAMYCESQSYALQLTSNLLKGSLPRLLVLRVSRA